MSTALRLGIVAFCCDFGLYVIMSAVPFRLLELGANSFLLGAVPALYAAPYAGLVLFLGGRSDSRSRSAFIRGGVLVAAVGALLLSRAGDRFGIALCIPVFSIGASLVWPSVQAGFSELRAGQKLSRQVGLYNLSWSGGKGLGFLMGGAMVMAFGPSRAVLVAGASYAVAALAVPPLRPAGLHNIDTPPGRPDLSPAERGAFLRSAWWINGVAFGVGAVFNHHLPKILVARGEDAARFGQLLGTIFLVQTVSFVLLARWRSWHYRLRELMGSQLLLALLALVAAGRAGGALLFVAAAGLGLCLGFCYQSSLYYSLHAPSGRGRQAGIHEASLGIASAILPFLGGLLAQRSAELRAPFWLASTVVAAAALLGLIQIQRARRA